MSSGGRSFEPIPGLWKFACAMAVLVGHNLVTLNTWHPNDGFWHWVYHFVQFFSPLHFFFFSGYLAAGGLFNLARPLPAFMIGRGLRIYVLVVAAFLWGIGMRLATARISGTASLGTLWPLGVWDGPIDWHDALMHLSPFGFANHTRFNYATWYLYQELRIVLLFPLFRWILHRSSSLERWGWAGFLMVAAALLEYKFWALFPLYRSSPFESLAYGCYFLAGSLVWMELQRPQAATFPSRCAVGVLVLGLAIAYLESFGIRPHVSNPPVLMVQTMVGQILVFFGLWRLCGRMRIPDWLRKTCEWSVGIYLVHPPLHVVATWIAVSCGSAWPLVPEIFLAVAGGAIFHHVIERPAQTWVKAIQTRLA